LRGLQNFTFTGCHKSVNILLRHWTGCDIQPTQNYYIDSFEKHAAAAIAAGALFRSIGGGVVLLFTALLLEKLVTGWGLGVLDISQFF
jgi:hypothetical protein